MRILVDGDACPSINLITNIAQKYHSDLFIYIDVSHNLDSDYATIIKVSTAYQSVDMKIMEDIKKDDLLITADYGLASLALMKQAKVISPTGIIYTNDNIDIMLNQRYINGCLRKQKIKTPNPKKRTKQDDINLENVLIKILDIKN